MPDVVLPCLDEEAALPGVLAGLPPGYRAVVADNGSTDRSAEVARDHGALVVHVAQRGFGAAVHGGIAFADRWHAEHPDEPDDGVVCVADADGSFALRDLVDVAGPVLSGDADLVLGARRPVARGAWPVHARLANRVLAWRLRRTAGLRLHDIGPLRAARRRDLLDLGVRDRRFGYPLEQVVRAARAGWRVREVPVAYAPRAAGTESKVTGTVRGTVRAVRDMRRVLRDARAEDRGVRP